MLLAMVSRSAPPAAALLVLAVLAGSAGCSPKEAPAPAPSASGSTLDCDKAKLPTKTSGKLTIGTDDPAYEPWFKDNKPENGEGFEGAVAYAVAAKLGYAKDDVTWVRVTFNNAIAPGPKPYDVDINQFSITEERRKAVDFSPPYYDVRQAVIALKSSKIAGAKSLAELRGARLGAQVGTTSFAIIDRAVKPTVQPRVYNSNDDAKKALQNKQIDGLVVDLPTAFYMTAAEIKDSVIVGQIPQPAGPSERFGMVLHKGSPLTPCVSTAMEALRADGTFLALERKWLAQVAGAAELS
jgi:polar amino acid transport system substrate-binding protein